MLNREDLPGYRIKQIFRISDPSSSKESSLDRQDDRLSPERQVLKREYDGKIIKTYRIKESASTMDRECLAEIYEAAKDDKFDILMVWAIHRLTRANIWETIKYLLKLREQEIIIYSHQDGYFDWSDNDDARRMIDRVIQARRWRNSINKGSIENCRDNLLEGHWPYGPLGYGLVDSEQDGIIIKEGYERFINEIYELFKSGEDPSDVEDIIGDRIKKSNLDVEAPSEGQIERLLENELYTGDLIERKSDELVREKDDLRIIDSNLFEKVQEKLDDSNNSYDDKTSVGPQDFPPFIYELITRLGQEYIVENISGIRWCCPKCQSTDINISTTTIEKWGISIPQIYCNKTDCYNGPVIRIKDLENIDSTLPLVCPECQKTGDFVTESISLDNIDDEMYKYTCNYCGEYMLNNDHPNSYRRALNSCNAINLREDKSDLDGEDRVTDYEDKPDQQIDESNCRKTEDPDQAVFDALESWLADRGPQTETARNILLQATKILDEEGPLKREELERRLSSSISHSYSSPLSLWRSTMGRFYEEVPGITRTSHGQYDFQREPILYFIQWTPDRG
jgi:DNA invertase Pin-like site-specific DNA recombinase